MSRPDPRTARVGLLLIALAAAAPARAEGVPTFLVKAGYGGARAALLAQGWQPVAVSTDPGRCAAGFGAQCAAYPETEYCAGGGLPRCVFLWRDAAGMLIELRTLGREEPVIEIVRCRLNCRAQAPERIDPPVADGKAAPYPAPELPAPYLHG